MCVPVQVMNHSVSNIEFEWRGMESVEGANISIEPKAGSVGTFGSADVATAYVHRFIAQSFRTPHCARFIAP